MKVSDKFYVTDADELYSEFGTLQEAYEALEEDQEFVYEVTVTRIYKKKVFMEETPND